jgi:hypothetical protein
MDSSISALLMLLMSGGGGIFFLLGQVFWIWMLIDCMRTEGPRSEWRYILFFANVAGALAYFVVRWLPSNPIVLPAFMRRWTYGQKLEAARAAAINIGNAHQYEQLGDIHLQMGNRTAALQAYQTALDKNAKSTNALWGIAQVYFYNQDWAQAQDPLERLLKLEPDARFGEASLMYGKVLYELQEWQLLKPHLEKDFRSWSHPESGVMLATRLRQEGNPAEAQKLLETMIARMQASPVYHQRKHQGTLRKARQLLRTLSN